MLEAYRLGTLGWSANNMSQYKQSIAWLHGIIQGQAIPPILRRLGNRRAGEIATCVGGIGFFLWGNAFQILGSAKGPRFIVGYSLIQFAFVNTWQALSLMSQRASIIEEGIRVTDCGQGELSAGYEGLELIVQVLMPPLAGRLYAEFCAPTILPVWLQWGGGGAYVMGGIFMGLSALVLVQTPTAAVASPAV
jgi:hypothetical protein